MTRACRPLTAWRRLAAPLCAAALLVPQPAAADTCSGLAFELPSVQATDSAPTAVVAADINRDGKMDVVTANSSGNSISVLLGNGPGLGPATSQPSGPSPTDIVAGDLDRDGWQDLVVASRTAPQVWVHKGLEGGSFATGAPSLMGVVSTRIALGDFDRDGLLDLVVVSEASHRVRVVRGQGSMAFDTASLLADLDLSAGAPAPSAAVPGDFDGDGSLDLAVALRAANQVAVFLGNEKGFLGDGDDVAPLPIPFAIVGTGDDTNPVDLAAADLNRDGKLDLVTANQGDGTAGVLLGAGDGDFVSQPAVAVGGRPSWLTLVDLDRDGVRDLVVVDLVAVDETLVTPRLVTFGGQPALPFFAPPTFLAPLPPGSGPRGLAIGDFTSDARLDLVTTLSLADQVVVVPNASGSACVRTSFAGAPRSYLIPDGPVSTAAADFDGDGRVDLAVATANDAMIRIRRGGGGDFSPLTDLGPFSSPPRAVAATDLDFDGRTDLVAALGDGSAGRVQVILRDAAGDFTIGPSLGAGSNTAAVAVGDFDGNGTPDVAAVSEGGGGVWVFLGDGAGGLIPVTGNPVLSGLSTPRALVAADLTGDGFTDLAIAESGRSPGAVHVLRSNGGGTSFFSLITPVGTGLPVGANPEGIAAANLDGDTWPDLVTANGAGTVSVIRRTDDGGFLSAEPYPVFGSPTAVALVDLSGDAKPDIAVTAGTAGDPTLALFVNEEGSGLFPTSSLHPVRRYPRAITPLDADADGRPDLAIPCQNADAVVVLLSRLPGPFDSAPGIRDGSGHRGVVSADLDGDGDQDLAVANVSTSTVSLLRNDGPGTFTLYSTPGVGAGPGSIVAADFNRDGRIDLALNAPLAPTRGASILLAKADSPGEFEAYRSVAVGAVPDASAVGDFNRDGIPDLAVCDKVGGPGYVRILTGDGDGGFEVGSSLAVADQPTAIVAADFDRDGDLDLAVGNEGADNVQILSNTAGSFSILQTLTLPGTDRDPLSMTAGDFNADGAVDLAVAAFGGDRLHVYRNEGTGTFATTPGSFDVPSFLQFVTVADVNLDARPDLLAVAAGLTVFRGRGGMDFDPPETVLAGRSPQAAAVGDFDRDGHPDVAVVNEAPDEASDDVSLLLSTACQARRLEVALHPAACETGPLPYGPDAEVRTYDEGGNLAACAAGTVVPSIAPGTGDPLATLGGAGVSGLPLAGGAVSFTGLTIDRPGRRYRLQFSLGGVPPVQTRSFTLGPELQILGTPSICPGGSSAFRTEGSYDQYAWTLDPPASPFIFTPRVVLQYSSLSPGPHTLSVATRIDGCSATSVPPLSIYAGPLQYTTLAIAGYSAVCVDCIGGTITPTDVGGGPVVSRQWGYRTTTGGPVTDMPGETGETYVLKGASFPGPGTHYVVVRTTPTCGTADTVSSELAVTVVSGVPTGEVQHLAASSRGSTALGGQVVLQWVNSTGTADEVRVRWNKAPDNSNVCVPPPDTVVTVTDQATITNPSAGVRDGFSHAGLVFDTAYCYSVFVKVGTAWSPGRTVKARPFNADIGPVKWAYATGATAVVPPVVGFDAVLAMSNDRTVHAITRGGATGGVWPSGWVPHALTGVAHSRSPVVPFVSTSAVFPGKSVLFVADDAGDVHAVDTSNGQSVWPGPRPQGKPVVGAPGGLFTQYGGVADLIVVGTRDGLGPNELRGLAVLDGLPVGTPFVAGDTIGPISGSPAIDYAGQRLYFASRRYGGGSTIWCVQVDGSTPFTPVWSRADVGEVDGSPVLRYGRVYFGTVDGMVYSLRASDGLDERTFSTGGDGPVKGFLFPDRRNDDLIFATKTKVWSISDDGSPVMPWNWQWTVTGLNPSVVLYWPGTSFVYVGGADGSLHELDFAAADQATPPIHKVQALGDGSGQIGTPSLDIGVEPPDVTAGKKLLIVGSEAGVLYGVEVPF